ncbi:hypothetical protein B0H15DRAFT_958682 [Mycena belliarum]|uniref:Uncharacterized protein n=1 Tax=Mycena belliarum TaxID=1033014 RepID=A0AAD6TMJ5_9AGAR|nr:hypothetical protein B0H15DRAFT_958682 [Mycena belliae]
MFTPHFLLPALALTTQSRWTTAGATPLLEHTSHSQQPARSSVATDMEFAALRLAGRAGSLLLCRRVPRASARTRSDLRGRQERDQRHGAHPATSTRGACAIVAWSKASDGPSVAKDDRDGVLLTTESCRFRARIPLKCLRPPLAHLETLHASGDPQRASALFVVLRTSAIFFRVTRPAASWISVAVCDVFACTPPPLPVLPPSLALATQPRSTSSGTTPPFGHMGSLATDRSTRLFVIADVDAGIGLAEKGGSALASPPDGAPRLRM